MNWTDMPPEIVDEILGHCDELCLLILGRVNHQLNSLALSRYLVPHVKDGVIRLHLKHPPHNLICRRNTDLACAFRTAFWLPRNIQHINYRLPPHFQSSYLDGYIKDLRDLTTFICRMRKLVSLRIDSGGNVVDWDISKRSHRDIWTELFGAAIAKGCEVFEIKEKGGARSGHSFSPPGPSWALQASILRSTSWLFHKLGLAATAKNAVTTWVMPTLPSPLTTGTVKLPLQNVQIDGRGSSDLPFVFYTILIHHAISLTRLSLTNLRIRDEKKLKKLFDCIHFTALEFFTFDNDWTRVPLDIFLKFLYHHPTLVELDLQVEVRISDVGPPKEWVTWRHPPKFPNLQRLRMPPTPLQWLVPDFRRCPKLRSVALTGDPWPNACLTGEPYNPYSVVSSVLNNLHGPALASWPLEVGIRLPLDVPYIVEHGEAPPCWSRVKVLRLKSERTLSTPLSDALVGWLSIFPSLDYLEIETEAMTEVLGKDFVNLFTAKCIRLTLLVILSSYGRRGQKREKWVVQCGKAESHTLQYF